MSASPSSIRLETEGDRGRYVTALPDGTEAEMTYVEDRPGVVIILHTYTPPKHRGQGVAAALVKKAVEDFRAGKKKVVPACSFARRQFAENRGWSDLIVDG
jgi:predicted GNAT family acetyltransferase